MGKVLEAADDGVVDTASDPVCDTGLDCLVLCVLGVAEALFSAGDDSCCVIEVCDSLFGVLTEVCSSSCLEVLVAGGKESGMELLVSCLMSRQREVVSQSLNLSI